jgi:formylglycine-generating enzyme required for sulfatase activity
MAVRADGRAIALCAAARISPHRAEPDVDLCRSPESHFVSRGVDMTGLCRLLLLAMSLAASSAALAEQRVALVIGNAAEAERSLKAEYWAAAERALAEAKRLKPDHAEVAAFEATLAAAKKARLAPGRVFRDCADCPEMVVIPAGTFTMGSPPTEAERRDNEGPQHRVTIAKPFAMAKYELTFAEWDACDADGGCKYRPGDNGWGRGRRPVTNVSWNDAKQYIAWLSRKTGKTYRLPGEAEWEYAARAGTTTPFATGATISTEQANYHGNYVYGSGQKGVHRGQTVPVGAFAANRFGLHDMHGNVDEWVEDCWNSSYNGAPGDGRAWLSGDCTQRVLRGGSWNANPRHLRSALRGGLPTTGRKGGGFRLARTLD